MEKKRPRIAEPSQLSVVMATQSAHKTAHPSSSRTDSSSSSESSSELSTEIVPSSDGTESVVRNPLVFSCKKCRTIVGDSLGFKDSFKDLKVIILRSTVNCIRGTAATSKTSVDAGSSYFTLQCNYCKEVIGRAYASTPEKLDVLRKNYALFVDKIDVFELGSSQV